jgi:hypothetical protein
MIGPKVVSEGPVFNVVGLTLDQISTGWLPQTQLAHTLEVRTTKSGFRFGPSILIYSTEGADTHGMVARTKYKEQGQFLLFLYFNDAAVEACKEMGIPLSIVDRIEDHDLPARCVRVLDRPYLAPIVTPEPSPTPSPSR